MAKTSPTDKFTPQLRGPTTDQESGVWSPEHASSFYRPSKPVPNEMREGDNPSALQIIQEMRGEYNPDDEACPGSIPSLPRRNSGGTNPLPVSVHTKSLSRKEPGPDPLLPPSPNAEDPPFKDELDSLQFALQRLQLSFPRVSSIDEQLKLASAINLITASIARLVKIQKYIASQRPVDYNREVQAALEVVIKEWASG